MKFYSAFRPALDSLKLLFYDMSCASSVQNLSFIAPIGLVLEILTFVFDTKLSAKTSVDLMIVT